MSKVDLIIAICKLSQAAFLAGVMLNDDVDQIAKGEHEDALLEALNLVEKMYEV